MAELELIDMLARLGLAVLLGGALGLEREYDGQDAGFRTHLLVVLGSALFATVSVGGFDRFAADGGSNVTVDVTRIAAYVAPGIGFIGGGVILKRGGHVSGITTAASLWTAAAIGVATGVGSWEAAVATTVVALIALELLEPVSDFAGRIGRRRHAACAIELAPDADVGAVLSSVVDSTSAPIRALRYGVGPDDDGWVTIDFWKVPSDEHLRTIVATVSDLDGVRGVTTDERF